MFGFEKLGEESGEMCEASNNPVVDYVQMTERVTRGGTMGLMMKTKRWYNGYCSRLLD